MKARELNGTKDKPNFCDNPVKSTLERDDSCALEREKNAQAQVHIKGVPITRECQRHRCPWA